jgi:ABC-2 type transport system permease protein
VVAHLLRLKLTLLRNGLKRSVWQVVGLVVLSLYALGGLAAATAGLVALSLADPDLIRTVLVLTGSLVVIGWWIVPLVAFGIDSTLDPSRFVTFAIPRRSLLTGLAASGLIGIPGVVTTLLVIAAALTWWHHPVALLVSVPLVPLALATCVVGSRASTTLLAPLMARRRYRELAAGVMILPFMLLGPILHAVTAGIAAGKDVLPTLATTAGWTPMGAVWAAPADAVAGRWGAVAVRVLVAVATLALLVLVWDGALGRALVTATTAGSGSDGARGHGLGAFGRLPGTPVGAVVARSLIYWRRDPRYAKALVVVPLIPLVMVVSSGGSRGGMLLAAGPLVALVLGWSISADVAYDGTAFWTHVATPLDGRADRAGRLIAAAMIGVPTVITLITVSVAVAGRWDLLPALLGASLGLLLTAYGGASVVSARVVYPVAKPEDNPFTSQQGGSMAAVVSQLLGWGAVLGLSLPELVLGGVAAGIHSVLLGVIALVVGVGCGTVVAVLGVRIGGRALDSGAPDLLARMVSFG